LTDVAAYVMDKDHEDEMKDIVVKANSWCRRKMNK